MPNDGAQQEPLQHSIASPTEQRIRDVHAYRAARFRFSLERLHNHPAVNASGPHSAYVPREHTDLASHSSPVSEAAPGFLVQSVFDDLVERELGTDVVKRNLDEKRAFVAQHLSRTRAVAPKPSLSDPHLIRRMCTGHDPSVFSDKKLLAKVNRPTKCAAHAPSAGEIHRALEEAQAQRSRTKVPTRKARENAAGVTTRLSKKRTREVVALELANKDADASLRAQNEPPEVTALRPSPEAVRRTRSASRKARRSSANATSSECCFCPDPELFGGEEFKSELIGPFVDLKGKAKLFVHFDCACWAPQVYTDSQTGQLRRVYDEYCRGRQLKCSECGGRGATIGCYIQRCKRVFHLRCLSRCKALRVERFFVAFCEKHAHLGKKQSYKNLMEAATIADVAAAHRREESTFGLDAPHSRYTQLRRRETEVIFSRKLGVCSHSGAFETSKVIFSHKRRVVLKKTDRLTLGDRTRSLLASAFDIASGRLAYMSVAGKEKKAENMTPVEARAALASREHTSLLLLRNLRGAPRWDKEQISVVKNTAGHVSSVAAGAVRDQPTGETVERGSQQNNPTQVDTGDNVETPVTRAAKRRRVNVSSSSGDEEGKGEEAGQASAGGKRVSSAPLPSFKKSLVDTEQSPEARGKLQVAPSQGPGSIGTDPDPESKQTPQKKTPNSGGKRRRSALSIAKDSNGQGEVNSSRQGLDGKVKSAWETFLEEQLPKERLLRPDDSEADALRNMARLWSLLSTEAREGYQERARCAGISGNASPNNGRPQPNDKESGGKVAKERQPKGTRTNSQRPMSRLDLGLFAGRSRSQHIPAGSDDTEDKPTNSSDRQASVSLPRKIRVHNAGNPSQIDEFIAVDWDDLLPTSLDGSGFTQKKDPVQHVRAPPSR